MNQVFIDKYHLLNLLAKLKIGEATTKWHGILLFTMTRNPRNKIMFTESGQIASFSVSINSRDR